MMEFTKNKLKDMAKLFGTVFFFPIFAVVDEAQGPPSI